MKKRKYRYSKEELEPIIAKSKSWAEVFRNLNLKDAGNGNHYRIFPKYCKEYKIDYSHFTGQAWNKGLTASTSNSIAKAVKKASYSLDEVFCKNSPISKGTRLRELLIKVGRVYKCEICNLTLWLDKPITLHVDHINGICDDNRLKNLRFVCPNCHQQTDTWGARNRKDLIKFPEEKKLKKLVLKDGVRKSAEALGISEGYLRRHLNKVA